MDKKEKKERKNSSHHRPHRHHHARDTITSAVQLQHPFSFENYNPLRRAQHHHHHRSRRDRSPEKSDANKDGTNEEQEQEPPKPQWSPEVEYAVDHPPRRLVTPDTIALERQLRERRQDHVSSALNALSRDAHTATRKLDDTYYALLQKVGLLKATIASFQDLHSCLDETTKDFATRSDSLVKDITGQIDAFQNMSQQDESIDQLVKRLHKAKERAESFESRLESCRLRLEQWEKKEQEKNKRNNRTWALALTGLTAFVILILAIVLWRKGSLASVTEKPSEWKEALGLERNKTAPGIHLADPKEEQLLAKEAAKWDRLLDEL
ncbi:hypothetical protein D6D18_04893 [Aureobasidium pullulans]|nr:hypothetical protein D6D18_04893 [Aureobasidium pullulans]